MSKKKTGMYTIVIEPSRDLCSWDAFVTYDRRPRAFGTAEEIVVDPFIGRLFCSVSVGCEKGFARLKQEMIKANKDKIKQLELAIEGISDLSYEKMRKIGDPKNYE